MTSDRIRKHSHTLLLVYVLPYVVRTDVTMVHNYSYIMAYCLDTQAQSSLIYVTVIKGLAMLNVSTDMNFIENDLDNIILMQNYSSVIS